LSDLFIWDAISEAFTLVCIEWHVYEKTFQIVLYQKRSQQMANISYESIDLICKPSLIDFGSYSLTGMGGLIALLCRRYDH
jgi:hypothetical protein